MLSSRSNGSVVILAAAGVTGMDCFLWSYFYGQNVRKTASAEETRIGSR